MWFGSETLEQELRVAGDHHQQIVEVVGDAACETSDGFHLLRLAQLLFESAAFGDVFGEELKDGAFFTAVGNRASRDAYGGIAAGTLALPFRDQAFERAGGAKMIG